MKMKKSLAMILVIALALSLSLALMLPVAAETTVTDTVLSKNFMAKEFQIAKGVSIPNGTVTFSYTVTGDGAKNPIISFSQADISNGTATKAIPLTDLIDYSVYTHAGAYEYTVTETNTASDGYVFSQAEYKVTVIVKNVDGGLEVTNVVVQKVKDDTGVVPEETTKVDTGDSTGDGTGSEFKFVNSYSKDYTPSEEEGGDPDAKALEITKTVTNAGDQTYGFTFKFQIDAPTAYADTTKSFEANNGISYSMGTEYTVTLKHGDSLSFSTLPAGATYTVSEIIDPNGADATLQNAGKYTTTVQHTNGTVADRVVSDAFIDDTVSNKVGYTNDLDEESITPTGIVMNNLPYILLILVAGATIILFIIKRRKENEA